MASITVTIEGEIDEVVATLRGMAGPSVNGSPGAVGEEETRAETSPPEPETPEAPEPATASPEPALVAWNAGYVTSFWRHLSDTAREAMLRVSRSPNHTQKRAQLMHTLRRSQRELSGSLSSQGHSLNRLKRQRNIDLPRPLTYDRMEDAYVLDADFANALRELGMN